MVCPNCLRENPSEAEYCQNCGTKLEGSTITHEIKDIIDTTRKESRYSGMKTIATVYRVLGCIVSLATMYIAYRAYEIQGKEDFSGTIIVLIIGGIISTILHSSGDRLKVIVDTEKNTRQTLECLRQILNLLDRNMEG